ncbi:MAG: endolytic transglycosylase MltG [Deltaproteobacteria bacterium]|nr:endolytic transglycosylase MltG [Deltaproteobacteria bacterium]NTV56383.1 endolytic transglycosylase MltG [Deltaproteobacteria bacterium]
MTDITRTRLVFISIGLFFLVVVFLSLGFAFFLMSPADKGGADQVFIVKEGSSLKEVAGDLETRGLITNKTLFVLWTRVKGYGKDIRAGEYSLSPAMAPVQLLEILRKGLVILYPVTIPEGFTRDQIADALEAKGLADKKRFLELTRDKTLLRQYGISGPSFEGYLFPDTYHFSRGMPTSAVLDTMVKRFKQVVSPLVDKSQGTGMKFEEVVILASIVEKETGKPEERPLIASVFLNRLRLGMRLESDPTVIYGIENFGGDLKKKDLTEKTPYNTYVIHGLTPGPIANPGLESIKAVMDPARTDYLYFVSRNDGSHQFSKTLAEHNRAVEMYQKRKGKKPEKTS